VACAFGLSVDSMTEWGLIVDTDRQLALRVPATSRSLISSIVLFRSISLARNGGGRHCAPVLDSS
jgi:hypothetical protein